MSLRPRSRRTPSIVVVTLLALVATGCSRGSPAPGQLATGPLDEPGDHTATIAVGGTARSYTLHTPTNYTGDSQLPLVVVLHAGGSTGEQVAKLTQFSELADEVGAFVLYPEGVGKQWNDASGSPRASTADDLGFLDSLVASVTSAVRIDAGAVFATGLSNGAYLAQRLGCERAGTFAAIAPVEGALPAGEATDCRPRRPVSVIEFHGTTDPLAPYDGGASRGGRDVLSAPESAMFWATAAGCAADPRRAVLADVSPEDGTRITTDTWTCPNRVGVTLYTVEGGGHTWAGGSQYLPEAIVGKVSQDLDATSVIWDFFAEHRRPG
jgi:polyhydroxybutyrate depolymerase